MISHRHRCIFVHIPKTGGTSVESVIWPKRRTESNLWMGFVSRFHNRYQTGGLQHLLARQIRLEVGEVVFRRYFKFAIVRNPWDRLVSQYNYLQKRKDLQDYLGVSATTSFADYIEAAACTDHVQLKPQVDFVLGDDGELLVDQVVRFETLAEDMRKILSRIGLAGRALPHTKQSLREKDYRVYYTAEMRDRTAGIYARDIAYFGYTF